MLAREHKRQPTLLIKCNYYFSSCCRTGAHYIEAFILFSRFKKKIVLPPFDILKGALFDFGHWNYKIKFVGRRFDLFKIDTCTVHISSNLPKHKILRILFLILINWSEACSTLLKPYGFLPIYADLMWQATLVL